MPGWDIAVSTDGAVAVEVNFPPGISTNRQATFGGMVGSRMLALLAFHANEWPQHNEPPTSRWRVGITR